MGQYKEELVTVLAEKLSRAFVPFCLDVGRNARLCGSRGAWEQLAREALVFAWDQACAEQAQGKQGERQ